MENTLMVVLTDILLGAFSVAIIVGAVLEIQTLIFARREEKRDKEYHDNRMERFKN